MKLRAFSEIILIGILGVLIFLFVDPLNLAMGDATYSSAVTLAICVYAITLLFFWKEKIHDEREMSHRFFASRGAFLVGSLVIMVGIVVQSFQHMLDPWLPATLIAMSIVKLTVTWYMARFR